MGVWPASCRRHSDVSPAALHCKRPCCRYHRCRYQCCCRAHCLLARCWGASRAGFALMLMDIAERRFCPGRVALARVGGGARQHARDVDRSRGSGHRRRRDALCIILAASDADQPEVDAVSQAIDAISTTTACVQGQFNSTSPQTPLLHLTCPCLHLNLNLRSSPVCGDDNWKCRGARTYCRLWEHPHTNNTLWLARATPRAWLAEGETITVTSAPSSIGAETSILY